VPGASSSRRRFPEDAAAGSWTEKGIWSGMGSGICICMGMGMGICICICMCMDMGTCMAAIGFCGGTMGFEFDLAATSLLLLSKRRYRSGKEKRLFSEAKYRVLFPGITNLPLV